MPLDFPATPTGGQTYVLNGVSYIYNATLGAWTTTSIINSFADISGVANAAFGVANGAFGFANGVSTNTTAAFSAANNRVSSVSASSPLVSSGGLTPSISLPTTSNVQILSFGVGTAASQVTGEIRATNNITAYYSDERLKYIISTIPNPVARVKQLSGVFYINNDLAESLGYSDRSEQVGVIAQQVEKVLPQIVKLAPFDTEYVDGKEVSKSGENYKTVQYEKLIPLLIEAIKELSNEVETLKTRLGE